MKSITAVVILRTLRGTREPLGGDASVSRAVENLLGAIREGATRTVEDLTLDGMLETMPADGSAGDESSTPPGS